MKYRVGFYIDHVYEVWNIEEEKQEFKGSLADCEAWIRLQEGGYFCEQFYCSSYKDGEWRCKTQCLECTGVEEQAKQ
jgi:hypothetical protein